MYRSILSTMVVQQVLRGWNALPGGLEAEAADADGADAIVAEDAEDGVGSLPLAADLRRFSARPRANALRASRRVSLRDFMGGGLSKPSAQQKERRSNPWAEADAAALAPPAPPAADVATRASALSRAVPTDEWTTQVSCFVYRYILRESCSQFDSLPLTSLTIPLFAHHAGQRALYRFAAHRARRSQGRRAAERVRRRLVVGVAGERRARALGGVRPQSAPPRHAVCVHRWRRARVAQPARVLARVRRVTQRTVGPREAF
jgi:hypothetical protein